MYTQSELASVAPPSHPSNPTTARPTPPDLRPVTTLRELRQRVRVAHEQVGLIAGWGSLAKVEAESTRVQAMLADVMRHITGLEMLGEHRRIENGKGKPLCPLCRQGLSEFGPQKAEPDTDTHEHVGGVECECGWHHYFEPQCSRTVPDYALLKAWAEQDEQQQRTRDAQEAAQVARTQDATLRQMRGPFASTQQHA